MRCVLSGTAVVALTPSLKVVRLTMDLFQHRYYRLNKIFMILIGQWPYQSTRSRRGFFAVLFFLSTSQIVPQILAFVKYHADWTITVECIMPFIYDAMCATKLISFIWNSEKTLKLLNRIRADWQVWAPEREVNVLHKYAEQGRKMTILYAVAACSNCGIFMSQPILSKIIDILLKNGSELGKFPFPVDYYRLDAQKYYFYIILYSYVCVFMISMIAMASDAMLIIYVQHGCGVFAALGHRLERIGKINTTAGRKKATYTLNKRDMDFEELVSCIDRHNDAIEYAKLIEASYTWIFFFIIGLGMVMINIILLQILMGKSTPEATTRFIVLVLVIMGHLYLGSYVCQNLMDHSINIRVYIHNGQWYRLSLKAQKLLQLMMMSCNVPCQMTIGNFFVMSMRTYWMILKTTMSYFTLMRSMQGL